MLSHHFLISQAKSGPFFGGPKATLVINTEGSGAGDRNFSMHLTNGVLYDFTISWGDGTSQTIKIFETPGGFAPEIKHVYPQAGIYTIKFF